jgi:ketosteroid isomerase-like protein
MLIRVEWLAGLKYDMVYCWIIKFTENRKIKQVRAYLDTDLLTRAIEENK